jgi:hypothetical protein
MSDIEPGEATRVQCCIEPTEKGPYPSISADNVTDSAPRRPN